MTWREFITRYMDSSCLDNLEDELGISGAGLDQPANEEVILDSWARSDSPSTEAFYLLEGLDIGSELRHENAVGGLIFFDGACPGNIGSAHIRLRTAAMGRLPRICCHYCVATNGYRWNTRPACPLQPYQSRSSRRSQSIRICVWVPGIRRHANLRHTYPPEIKIGPRTHAPTMVG